MGVGAKISTKISSNIAAVRQDANLSRVGLGFQAVIRWLRRYTGHYLLRKVPIVSWIPAYFPIWAIEDLMAGVSVAIVMFPQAVLFSTLASLPVQVALTSCWLSGVLYSVMGTSKDVSPGPVLMPSIIIGGIIESVSKGGVPPTLVAAVLSFCVGIWSLIFGLLNIGFLYDSLPLPVVLGFTCGLSIIAYLGQVPTWFGMVGVSPLVAPLTGQFFTMLPETNVIAFGLGAASIVLLVALQFLEKKMGPKNEAIRTFARSRNLLLLLVSIVVSYVVNKDREEPLWLSVGPVKTEISSAQVPNMELFKALFFPSFTLWAAIATEHAVMAKALGRLNGYVVDPSQEWVFLGVVNLANSFMGGLPVGGGDMSRAAVNTASGVRSPLAGIFSAIILSVGMYPASSFVEWLPLPVVAAVIIVAVINSMPPIGDMGKYWKVSFTDFGVFLATFNGTLITTPETGISLGGGIIIAYTILRWVFSRPRIISTPDLEHQYGTIELSHWNKRKEIPQGTYIVSFESDLIYANAQKTTRRIVDTAMTNFSGVSSTQNPKDRMWSDLRDRKIQHLRREAGVNQAGTFLPPLRILIFDLSSMAFIDSSGLHALEDIKTELLAYAGPAFEVRFVGVHGAVWTRFKRWGWILASSYDEGQIEPDGEAQVIDFRFDHLIHAIHMSPQKDIAGNVPPARPLRWEGDDQPIFRHEEWQTNRGAV
ncbi:sulfate transporter family-domain-containing protein [Biscogniauxia marginata]|nr:sulfate transporter family-domain-containing protein [Biscogniauxia marginata]